MRAVWQIWLQPWLQVFVLTIAGHMLWVCGMGLVLLNTINDEAVVGGLSTLGAGAFFTHLAQGQTLRGLCVPENFLLPEFRQRLFFVGLLDAIQWTVLPVLLRVLLGQDEHALLLFAGMLGVSVFALSMGCGRRVGLLSWVVAIGAGWKPRIAVEVVRAGLASPLTAPLLLLLIGWLLLITLRPLLRIRDAENEVSPLESLNLSSTNLPANGAPQPRGALGKRVAGWFEVISQRALDGTLVRYYRQPGPRQRLALIRRLLLPHDNLFAVALRLVLVAAVVIAYFFAMQHRQHFDAAVVGAYALLLSLSRFPQLARGMLRMRPNLADLYLTLAPRTYADFQKTIADALSLLVPISVLTTLAYTLLGIALVHAAEPYRMLLTALIITLASSPVALAIHLIGPEANFGRTLVNMVLVVGAIISYWCAYWVIGALGYAIGGGLTALITLSFGISVWFAAQREYQRRLPSFDAPLV